MNTPQVDPAAARPSFRRVTGLALASLGVVYGDIGTSPLYAMKECFHGEHSVQPTPANILGVLSLILWSLTMVVSVKYLAFIMKADNRGEGGIFALLALVPAAKPGDPPRFRRAIILTALFGAALLYGDGVITPAISVLSAVEGLNIATKAAEPFVVPLTCAILVGLFLVQRRGTEGIGKVFGPVMIAWFVLIAGLGIAQVARHPGVLRAVSPWYGVRFFLENRGHGFLVLGSVVLAITGGEALYADMGHFGKRPIRLSWFLIVFPALLFNYMGQGALMLESPHASENPFYGLVPGPLLIPMVILATVATVIASQALISGAFSLTRQAIQLGYCPRMTVIHTSAENEGQIYMPQVNSFLMVACVAIVLAFQSSSRLAAAYGIAVTGTMAITTVVFYVVTTQHWGWPTWRALPLCLLFLTFDCAFFGANLLKFLEGGWLPIAVAVGVFTVMSTWNKGRQRVAQLRADSGMPLAMLLEEVGRNKIHRVPGTAVFLTGSSNHVPAALLHHLKHNQILHEKVMLLHIVSEDQPRVPARERLEVKSLDQGFFELTAHYGFMQTPNIPGILSIVKDAALRANPKNTSFYLGRETILVDGPWTLWRWRKKLFAYLARNAQPPGDYFGLPPGRVVEMGMQLEL